QIIEGQQVKPRPWLVISKNLLHQNSSGCVLLAITTNPANSPFMIPMNSQILQSGSLDRINESKIIIDKPVYTLFRDIIDIKGKITPDFYSEIVSKIKNDVLEI
ncbi:MAG: type II toxin-antitoxin system PemK/MazF family toxin, partial [Nitrosotalea sp.]